MTLFHSDGTLQYRTVWVASQFTSKFTDFLQSKIIANKSCSVTPFLILSIFGKTMNLPSFPTSLLIYGLPLFRHAFCSCSWWQYSKLGIWFVCVYFCLYVCMHACFKLFKHTPKTIKLIDFLLWIQHYEYSKVIQLSISYFLPTTGNVNSRKTQKINGRRGKDFRSFQFSSILPYFK